MPRPHRLVLPDAPLHVTQRGVDRGPTFFVDDDFAFYRWALDEAAMQARCAVHAYVLMTNHVHLLLTPADSGGPSRMMQSLGRRYVRFFNDRYRRTGTLWEGRYWSAPMRSESHLLACFRYIELNPVRAGMVADPRAYAWSSYGHNALGCDDPVVTPHPRYLALAATVESAREAYRTLFADEIDAHVLASLRAAPRGRAWLPGTTYRELVQAMSVEATRLRSAAGGAEWMREAATAPFTPAGIPIIPHREGRM